MSQTKQLSLLEAAVEYTTELRWIASETLRLHREGTNKAGRQLIQLRAHFVQLDAEAENLARHLSVMVEHGLPESEETPDFFLWKLRSAALEQAIQSARVATGGDK
jgi:hypothetical protein